MSDSSRASDEGLVRAIGVRALGISIVNLVVGGGIFVLPGLIAVRLGPAAIAAYLVCSLAVALVFLCFAEIGSRITRSGGAYAAVATEVFGEWGAKMLQVGGVISIYSTIRGDMLSAPRVVFASARDNKLPGFLAAVHLKYKTPYVSVIFFAAIVCAFALSGTFKPLAVLASGSILVIYGGVSLAVLRLRYRDGEPSAGQFKLPFGSGIPISSCFVVAWLLWQLTVEEATGLAALIGVSVLVYAIRIVSLRVLGEKKS